MKERISPQRSKLDWLGPLWFLSLTFLVVSDVSSCSSQLKLGWYHQSLDTTSSASTTTTKNQNKSRNSANKSQSDQATIDNVSSSTSSTSTSNTPTITDEPSPLQQLLNAATRQKQPLHYDTEGNGDNQTQNDVCLPASDTMTCEAKEYYKYQEVWETAMTWLIQIQILLSYLYTQAMNAFLAWFSWLRSKASLWSPQGPALMMLWNIFCLVESVRRGYQAHRMALDMAALDALEQKLFRLYTATKRSTSFFRTPFTSNYHSHDHHSQEEDRRLDFVATKRFLRVWTPLVTTIICWTILMPWPAIFSYQYFFQKTEGSWRELHSPLYYTCQEDPSYANTWIVTSLQQLQEGLTYVLEQLTTLAWKLAMPFRLWQPFLLIRRLRLLSTWVRYFRYAGPLLRLCIKLQDQFWVFTRTWRQQWMAKAQKAQVTASRSMLFQDLQKLEHRISTYFPQAMSNSTSIWKRTNSKLSQFSHSSTNSLTAAIQSSSHTVTQLWAQKKEDSQRLQRQIQDLKWDLSKQDSEEEGKTSEIYDRMIEVTQEVSSQVQSAFWNAHLISPHTRFSICWRLLVTIALLSELGRLLLSWQVSETFDLRYRDLTVELLGLCQTKSTPIRTWAGKLLRLPPTHPWLDTCRTSSWSSQLSLKVAGYSEIAIDVIGFLDIWVWFSTGELDENGVVVPKPFISRCIIPGTLLQLIDHPTVPKAIPILLRDILQASKAVGYARSIRWILCLSPAFHYFIVEPVYQFLFRPMDEEEYRLESMHIFPSNSSILRPEPTFSEGKLVRQSSSSRLHKAGITTSMLLASLPESPASMDSTEDEFPEENRGSFLPQGFSSQSNGFHNASVSESDGYGLYY